MIAAKYLLIVTAYEYFNFFRAMLGATALTGEGE